jgi:general secretion pathway protein E
MNFMRREKNWGFADSELEPRPVIKRNIDQESMPKTNDSKLRGFFTAARTIAPAAAQVGASRTHGDAISRPAKVYTTLKDLPAYRGVLTEGSNPVYRVAADIAGLLTAIDSGANDTHILRSADIPASKLNLVESTLTLLRGRLESSNWRVVDMLVVAHSLLREVVDNERSNTGLAVSRDNEALRRWRSWVDYAIRARSSDLHVQATGVSGTVKLRVDGDMCMLDDSHGGTYTSRQITDSLQQSYRESTHGHNATDYSPDALLNCIIEHQCDGVKYMLRWTQIPGPYGPKVVARIIESESSPTRINSFDKFGIEKTHADIIRAACRRASGIVVFIGPTGAGKSTLQRVAIEQMPNLSEINIETVETPVESPIHGTHQGQIIETGKDETDRAMWQSHFTACMRHDLDMLVVQELVNTLTMQTALKAARTGHLAFGTAHVHLIGSVAGRLTDDPSIGLSRGALTSPGVLNAVIYVNLVAKLCDCKVARNHLHELTELARQEALETLELLDGRPGLRGAVVYFRRQTGCSKCKGTGILGRVPICEAYQPDTEWLRLTRDGMDIEAEAHRRLQSDRNPFSNDMRGKTAYEHALLRALRGEIDPTVCEQFMTSKEH